MIVHKIWEEKIKWGPGSSADKEVRIKEGWFLLGFIPLYVKTISLKS